jgi:hypothetical protein
LTDGQKAQYFAKPRKDHAMFLPATHDAKDAISKFAGFIGMVASITLALNLILPNGGALSGGAKLFACLVMAVMVGVLSFSIQLKK